MTDVWDFHGDRGKSGKKPKNKQILFIFIFFSDSCLKNGFKAFFFFFEMTFMPYKHRWYLVVNFGF